MERIRVFADSDTASDENRSKPTKTDQLRVYGLRITDYSETTQCPDEARPSQLSAREDRTGASGRRNLGLLTSSRLTKRTSMSKPLSTGHGIAVTGSFQTSIRHHPQRRRAAAGVPCHGLRRRPHSHGRGRVAPVRFTRSGLGDPVQPVHDVDLLSTSSRPPRPPLDLPDLLSTSSRPLSTSSRPPL